MKKEEQEHLKGEKVLYQSIGVAPKMPLLLLACGILLAISSIVFFYLRSLQKEYLSGYTGYVYDDGSRMKFLIIGIVILLFALKIIYSSFLMKKVAVTMYEDYVDFTSVSFVSDLKRQQIFYKDIDTFNQGAEKTIIKAGGKSYVLWCKDKEKALYTLQRCIQQAKSK